MQSRLIRRRFSAALCLVGILFSGACHSKLDLDQNGVPHTLVVAVTVGDNPADVTAALDKIQAYLERKLGMPVEFLLSTDYTSVNEAIMTKKVHMAYINPFSYVLITQQQKLVPLVMVGYQGKPYLYRSVLITSSKSGIMSMDDVRARAKSLTLCYADPASTSGHLVPRAYLHSIGLEPKTAFKSVMFAQSHLMSILTVKAGKVDVGCTFELMLKMALARHQIDSGDIRVLWTSDPIVEGCICMRTDISPAFDQKVLQAYMDMPKEDSAAFRSYFRRFLGRSVDSMGYIVAQDSFYNGLRKIAAGIGDFTNPD